MTFLDEVLMGDDPPPTFTDPGLPSQRGYGSADQAAYAALQASAAAMLATLTAQYNSQNAIVNAAAQQASSNPTAETIAAFQNAYNYCTGAGQAGSSRPALTVDGLMGPTTQAALSNYTNPINGEFGLDGFEFGVEPEDMTTARTLQAAPIKSAALVIAFQNAYNTSAAGITTPLVVDGILGPKTSVALAQYDFNMGGAGDVQAEATALDQAPVKTPALVTAFQVAYNAAGAPAGVIATDGILGPDTAAALASYISTDREQLYLNAFQSGVTSITTQVPGDSAMAGEQARWGPGGSMQPFGSEHTQEEWGVGGRQQAFGVDMGATGAANATSGTSGSSAMPAGMDTSAAKVLQAAAVKSPALIKAFQLAYNAAGNTPALSVDGILGPLTNAALAKYTGVTLGTNTSPATAPNPPYTGPALGGASVPATLPAAVPQSAPPNWWGIAAVLGVAGAATWWVMKGPPASAAVEPTNESEEEPALPTSEPSSTTVAVKRRARV